MKEQVLNDILEPLVLHAERGEINKEHFVLISKAFLQCIPLREHNRLVQRLSELLIDTKKPSNELPPGNPWSTPY